MIFDSFKKLLEASRARRLALRDCELARLELDAAVHDALTVYHDHPMSLLAAAAGLGFVLAQLRVGSGLVKAGLHFVTGPAWRLLR